MADERNRGVRLTPFEQWVQTQGLKVVTRHTIHDIFTEELGPWERTGCRGALLDMTHDPSEHAMINNQGTTRYLVEIPPGGTFKAEKHMYEEIFYVVKGRGATVVWYEGMPKHTFEWQEDGVFAIPLNAWHEIYNGSGTETVRLYAATNMPTPFNLYGSPEFVFKCPMNFTDRFDPGDKKYFSGESIKLEDRLSQANFIPSVTKMALDLWAYRGPGTNMDVLMAGGRFICHVSEFPKGSYKKAHGSFGGRHRPPRTGLVSENSYLFLSGEGYDLQWAPGVLPGLGVEWKRADFKRGSLMTNGHGIHQHFNTSDEAARYLVLRCADFPFGGGSKANEAARGVRGQEMGDRIQIEFENEDPRIRPMFEEECRRRSVRCAMPAT